MWTLIRIYLTRPQSSSQRARLDNELREKDSKVDRCLPNHYDSIRKTNWVELEIETHFYVSLYMNKYLPLNKP